MASQQESPYVCHVFVCTNDRKGSRNSCAEGNSQATRSALKKMVKDKGWNKQVRVSQSGCLGLCGKGPNVLLYPQGIWFSDVSNKDVTDIVEKIKEIIE